MVIDRIDQAVVGAMQVALQLQVIGRVGKDQIDRACWKGAHQLDAIACQYLVARKRHRFCRFGFRCHICPQIMRR